LPRAFVLALTAGTPLAEDAAILVERVKGIEPSS
jgi:hypothetical protein